ncbi:50S ribosomal subunit protein L18 [Candidatus Blochmanniella floridana]|uniref:Large ribosomal subunit protein uL18 n=1 Tax=Blochmanniella floridana TaxID=203907 RepID=RL18_BLOFL|nr:RecName: Full=Large ribosomal subunit protein uL18; AltName: Full=50S ribosomal protein L18 [Candidatus Blochmannia floridanus]CAD83722.1 50S ribosomal subunit protein L18 [Candidatus Blochmannia floridanus]
MNKKLLRARRALKLRKKLYLLGSVRLVVYRSLRHMYAQIVSEDNCNVLVAASTTEKLIASKLRVTGNKEAAAVVGQVIAERAFKKGIVHVSFDRSGFKYHGRVQILAEYARQFGLKF